MTDDLQNNLKIQVLLVGDVPSSTIELLRSKIYRHAEIEITDLSGMPSDLHQYLELEANHTFVISRYFPEKAFICDGSQISWLTFVQTCDENIDELYCLQTFNDQVMTPKNQVTGILRDILGLIYLGNDHPIGVDLTDLHHILQLKPSHIYRVELSVGDSCKSDLEDRFRLAIHNGLKTLNSDDWYGLLTFHYSDDSDETFDVTHLIEVSQIESDSDNWIYSAITDLSPDQPPYISIMLFNNGHASISSSINIVPQKESDKEAITS